MIDPCSRNSPLLVAHRAGNSLAHLKEAEAVGVDLVECDLWLHRAQLEVRHEKTAGVLPILWDRWSLSPGWTPRWTIADLLQTAQPDTMLFFDLKGIRRQLPELLIAAIAESAADRPYAVSSQHWDLLTPFQELPSVTRFCSVGNALQLRALPNRLERDPDLMVSINSRLLSPEIVRELKTWARLVIPWRVRSMAQVQELLDWGVDGVNVDDLDLLRQLVTKRM